MSPPINRRTALAAPLALSFAAGVARADALRRPRNIIFILVDDLRFDSMGFLHPGLKTPNIDRLAHGGVHFANAFVTTSLCSPSRATILTGLPMRDHGIVDNNNPEPPGTIFYPSYLQKAGYQTAFIGKWHMGAASDAPRAGFDHWVSFAGQGHYYPTDGLTPEAIAAGQTQVININGRHAPQRGYITDELTDYALDWLSHGRDAAKPFFLQLAHKAVHAYFEPSPAHAKDYADLPIAQPPSQANTRVNNAGKPMWVQNQRNSLLGADFAYNDTKDIRDWERQYFQTLESVDDSLGRLLTWLDAAKLTQDTAVFFTSDNGMVWGEHGLIDKRTAYEDSIRIPLVAYAPGLFPAGTKVDGMVANLDFAPTMLDIAGAPQPPTFKGRSFLDLARGMSNAGDPELIYEYYWEFNYPQTPTMFAIRTPTLKYIQYYGVWDTEELYDLSKDPDEMTNLVDDDAYLDAKVDLRHRLYLGLADGHGDHAIRYGEKFNSGSLDRYREGPPAAQFPDDWLKEPGDPALNLHMIPDSRAKAAALKAKEAAFQAAQKQKAGGGAP